MKLYAIMRNLCAMFAIKKIAKNDFIFNRLNVRNVKEKTIIDLSHR